MKTVRVAAGIIQRDNEVLAVQRGYGEMDGLWEFPGGKIDTSETPEEACLRELREELDVRITSLQDFYTLEYDYPDFHLSMNCFLCHLDEESGEPARNDRQRDMRWVHKSSLATLEWMPADIELVNMLVRMGEEEEQALVKRRAAVRKSMQGNKRRDTKPELLVRQRLRAAGLTGYRLDWAKAPGRPEHRLPRAQDRHLRQRVLPAPLPTLQPQHAEQKRRVLGGEVPSQRRAGRPRPRRARRAGVVRHHHMGMRAQARPHRRDHGARDRSDTQSLKLGTVPNLRLNAPDDAIRAPTE